MPESHADGVEPTDGSLPADVSLATPEPALATRIPPPERERPVPSSRRAIFFDIENTSRVEHIARVIDHLAIDRMDKRTDFFAIGNWRVIGHDTARLLARHGAQLVHSAPSVGVRDWSDLRIAVTAGVWLAAARPGDVIEIISDDRAFDAVGDVAAALGIAYRRLSYRGLIGVRAAPTEAPHEREAAHTPPETRGRRGRRGGRRRRGREWREARSVPHAPAPAPAMIATDGGGPSSQPHTAPHEEIVNVVRDLAGAAPGREVTLDMLANALKARGFSRPPGSPRLITRLRRIRELEVSRNGTITLVAGATQARALEEPVAAVVESEAPEPGNEAAPAEGAAPERRRRTRRGGRRRRSRGGQGS